MRLRFRLKNRLFAAETLRAGEGFEVRVFLLSPSDGYFRSETQASILRLRGASEEALIELAVSETESWIRKLPGPR